MTDRIDEIRAREQAATEGPWEEEWRAIPGYEGYEVSNFGNVRSYLRKGNHKEKRSNYPMRTLKTVPKKSGGYQTVSLPGADGKYRHQMVHRLVMLAFQGPCPEGMEVAHLNGDSSDARFSNLAYVTHIENESHKARHGTNGAGERNAMAKMQGWQVAEMKYLASKSVPQGKIASLFDVTHKQVSQILSGRTWSDEPAREDVPFLLAEVDHLKHRLDAANGQAKEAVALYQETRSERDRLQAKVDAVLRLIERSEKVAATSPARMFDGGPFAATVRADDLRRAITEAMER